MEMPTRLAVAMSGLVFVGGAVLAVTSAGAEAMAIAPQQLPAGHGGHHSARQSQRGDQRTVIINRIVNIARINNDQGQGQGQREHQRLRNHQGDTSANAEAAAGGYGGAHSGGGGAATSHDAAGGGGASGGGGGGASTPKAAAGGGGGGGGGDIIYNPNQHYNPVFAQLKG
jgi:hypothetical protein